MSELFRRGGGLTPETRGQGIKAMLDATAAGGILVAGFRKTNASHRDVEGELDGRKSQICT